ncbi:MAG: heavy-metal-associated domain-containing protein [Thiohalomonadales bacterium]
MIKKLVVILVLVIWNLPVQATESSYPYIYQGKVQGMVCAFCVYSVSKKIGSLPEINAKTVNVDLKSKIVNFRSSSKVNYEKLANVFSDSGFKLVELNEVKEATLKIPEYQSKPVLSVNLDSTNIQKYQAIIESIGEIAATSMSKLVINAPEAVEIALLKPMIGGKQKIARIEYNFEKNKTNIEIKLFLKKDL